jgi:hypothetical protein
MKKLILVLLLATGCLYPAVAGPKKKPSPSPTPSPTPTPPPESEQTYYKWLNDFAHYIETHPPTPDQQ